MSFPSTIGIQYDQCLSFRWYRAAGEGCETHNFDIKAIAGFLRQLSLYLSVAHTTKSRIHILIMWLKPVAERRTYHAACGARGATFHHIVLSVEKVRRVAFVERERLESWQRAKLR